jgi:hypothetical protein
MKVRITFLLMILSVLLAGNTNAQVGFSTRQLIDSAYIPLGSGSAPGNGVFTGPISNTARTYQLLIHKDQLSALNNKDIKAIRWRQAAAATTNWPPAEVIYANYDIYLSESVPPADRSLTFALNVVGPQTRVRFGPLTISPEEYTFGNTPNLCGKEISFDTSWLYTGGHLLIEIRLSASNGTSKSVDAFTTSATGYGTLFSAAWTGSYTGLTGTQGNFSVISLSYDDPVPVELTSFSASASGNNVVLNWVTATETNNSGFEVERLTNGNWKRLGFVSGNGTVTETSVYNFVDKNLLPGTYSYRLKQIDFDGAQSYSQIVESEIDNPMSYSLEQNYPNPFNPTTTINYSVKENSNIKITLFNSLGEQVKVLLNEVKETGFYSLSFNAAAYPAGTYFYEMRSDNFVQVKKMTLLK